MSANPLKTHIFTHATPLSDDSGKILLAFVREVYDENHQLVVSNAEDQSLDHRCYRFDIYLVGTYVHAIRSRVLKHCFDDLIYQKHKCEAAGDSNGASVAERAIVYSIEGCRDRWLLHKTPQ